uniref:Uncharacterized protein n=1 Tax=Oryza rufipogon TaxID=4529 RepID=A0A0E0Q6R5_ORYRU
MAVAEQELGLGGGGVVQQFRGGSPATGRRKLRFTEAVVPCARSSIWKATMTINLGPTRFQHLILHLLSDYFNGAGMLRYFSSDIAKATPCNIFWCKSIQSYHSNYS